MAKSNRKEQITKPKLATEYKTVKLEAERFFEKPLKTFQFWHQDALNAQDSLEHGKRG